MQRMVWQGYLLIVLILVSATYRFAYAGIEDYKSKKHPAFHQELVYNNISPKIIKFSDQLYDLLSLTKLSTNYANSAQMMSALESSWEKQALLSMGMNENEMSLARMALEGTPLMGTYSRSKPVSDINASKLHTYPLVIFFSSHVQSMAQHLANLKRWIQELIPGGAFAANIILVTSSSTYYSVSDLASSALTLPLYNYLIDVFREDLHISQEELAKEMLMYYFSGWHIIKTVYVKNPLYFSPQFEGALSEQRNFIGFSDVILATPQPYCEVARVIATNNLPHNAAFHHSCFDFNAQNPKSYFDIDVIADSLNAFKQWIKTETKHFQKKDRY